LIFPTSKQLFNPLRALKSAMTIDQNSLQACFASLSSRLYTVASENDRFLKDYSKVKYYNFSNKNSNALLISENVIRTLGKLGVDFVEDVSSSELIFQVLFHLEHLIINMPNAI
jgi:hypothetical protein